MSAGWWPPRRCRSSSTPTGSTRWAPRRRPSCPSSWPGGSTMAEASSRPAWAEVDLGAVRGNVGALVDLCAPAAVCAVVKADGYGHGAVAVARAALEAGATWLAVAVVEEGVALRRAGITSPILVLAEPPPAAAAEAVAQQLTPTLYTSRGVEAAQAAAAVAGDGRR